MYTTWMENPRTNKLGLKEQLCWSCANYGRCSWARKGQPVDGWDAEEVSQSGGVSTHKGRVYVKNNIATYFIYDCPQFEQEVRNKLDRMTYREAVGVLAKLTMNTKSGGKAYLAIQKAIHALLDLDEIFSRGGAER